tara:strand:+ start:41552 stop:41692 length:141 start_codon:yes stop_codon:yes gene_type:complete
MDIEIGAYTGLLFGVRTFEPTEMHPYWEFHIYIPLIYIAFFSGRPR